jgi:thiamine pyrophosphokinase
LRAVIIANGTMSNPGEALAAIHPGDLLIAADGGAQHYRRLGLKPAVVVGDLDSLPPEQKEGLVAEGTELITYPRDKNQTDLELALHYAASRGAEEILLLGLLGGRLDQTLANLLLLSKTEWESMRLSIIEGPDKAHVLRQGEAISLSGQAGDIASLIPLSPTVSGVTTQGLRWPLSEANLQFGSTLGISNEMTGASARISLGSGLLLVIHRENGAPAPGSGGDL